MRETTRIKSSPEHKETVTIKTEQQKEEPTREERQHERSRVQENIKKLIKDWRGKKESDQDLVRTTQEYMATLNTSEIKPTEEEERLGEQVKVAMGRFIGSRIIRWNPENRKSETQIKEMIMMCNKSTLMIGSTPRC